VPDRKPGRLDPHGGASAARPELNWRSVNTRSRSEKGVPVFFRIGLDVGSGVKVRKPIF
jgi:hypothetical protein